MLPSEIKLKSHYGYHRNICEGWQKLPDAMIVGDGYSVNFSRLSECTIDRMCDALNGWYNIWTKFCCEYTDRKGTLSITVRKPEDADKLYNMLLYIKPVVFEHEGTISAADAARIKMETMIGWIRNQKKQ